MLFYQKFDTKHKRTKLWIFLKVTFKIKELWGIVYVICTYSLGFFSRGNRYTYDEVKTATVSS